MTTDAGTELWGGETAKAVENFPVSGHPIPAPVVHWLGRVKAAAARVNAELGLLEADLAERIAAAGDAVGAGEHDEQFPVDVFQTGSGTSSNMNANEVHREHRRRPRPSQRPREHGPVLQRRLPLGGAPRGARARSTEDLLPAMDGLAASLEVKAEEFADVVKAGRTHLMDAVPVTLGQEFGGYAAQIRLGSERVRATLGHVGPDPARRDGHGHRAQHPLRSSPARVRRKLTEASGARHPAAGRPLRGPGQPRCPGRALGRAEGGRRLADQDRQRPGADGLRPARRPR